MITKRQADNLKNLINNVLDSQYEYDRSVSREEDGYADLCFGELINSKSVLYGFIEELTNDNQC